MYFHLHKSAEQSLNAVIKSRRLDKYYLAKVVGVPKDAEQKLIAYLKKDSQKSLVYVSDVLQNGYDEIRTNYKKLEFDENFAILEVELVTGKTHQIRAHLSHIGYPILGDDKYGDSETNKKYGKKYQCLCAYKLIFHFDSTDYLAGLDGLCVEIDKSEISFL